jgi:type I restriction enzyme S subunit
MAKKSNNANLSIEEMLEQAKIASGNEPYKIPKNWCWVCLESINQYVSRSVNPLSEQNKLFELYSVPSSQDNYPEIIRGGDIGSTKQSVEKDDVLLCKINPRINRVWKVSKYTENTLIASSEWIVIRNSIISSKYLMWCMRSPYFREYMLSNVSGIGGSLMRAKPEQIRKYPIVLAPLQEQCRIVEIIETMFSKLDVAKEKAQEILDNYEMRMATILYRAFSGELTAKWRRENGIEKSQYPIRRFSEIAEVKSNLVDPAEYLNYPHIAPDNIEKKTGVLLDYRTIGEDGVKSGKHRFYSGQILYSKIRPNLSKVIVVDFDGLCSADMYPIEAKGDAKCLWYYMLSEEFLEQASSAGSRSVLPKINQKELSVLKVRIPSCTEEQREISRILDNIFEKERETKQSAEYVIEQIDLMKKSILSKAFRGELGTNNPKDERAEELLKRIIIGE